MKLSGRNFAGFLFFMSLSAVGLGNIAFWAFNGNAGPAFVSALTAWVSYIFAHYMMEGVFIDVMKMEDELFEDHYDIIVQMTSKY